MPRDGLGNAGRRIARRFPRITRLARRVRDSAPFGARLDADFWDWYRFFEESESWDQQKMLDYQLARFRSLLDALRTTSSYYRERLLDVDIADIHTMDGVRRVPTLFRNEFRTNFSTILSTDWESRILAKGQTSGTTGSALQFYHEKNDQAREWAAICHQWKRIGYVADTSRRAEFRSLTEPGNLIELFPRHNMLRCSILHLRHDHLRHYANVLRKYDIEYLHGYPSAIFLLATGVREAGMLFPQPKGILLASEMVFPWQLRAIREAFPEAKVFAHYGCAERTVLAGWCEHRQEYHVLPQYSLVEVDGSTSEIVGTNLYNTINGFVRYRMTDTALKVEATPCPDCGRSYTPRLVTIGGRTEDYLFSPQHGWIPPAIVTYPLKSLRVIREMQLYQKEADELIVRYTVSGEDAEAIQSESAQVASGLHELFGPQQRIRFVRVDGFERGPTGKFKWIVCDIDETPMQLARDEVDEPPNDG
jgi:phenylacetate-CoA ligase